MSGISADVRDIVEELDADGSGYQTKEAANLLVHRYVLEGVCNPDGDPKPKVRTLMRMGANTAFKNYRSDTAEDRANREKAAAWAGGEQGDFVEIDEGFGFEWLRSYAAWDETELAERKMLIRMTLPEVLEVITFKRKKIAEASAVVKRLQDIVDDNPHWHDEPSLTMADILGIIE